MNFTSLVSRQLLNTKHLVQCIRKSSLLSHSLKELTLPKMASDKPKVIFVLGAPGSGKGTQCEKIVKNFGFKHLSAGDLLREERARTGSKFGNLIDLCIKEGTIVPVNITCSLIENAMIRDREFTGNNKFLIDGFPRNKDNLLGWNEQMGKKVEMLFVLFLDCTQDKCVDRCLKRGEAGSGRSDDNLESLQKRFNTYLNDTMPIIEHYRKMDKVEQIDTTPCADDVYSVVEGIFKKAEAEKLF